MYFLLILISACFLTSIYFLGYFTLAIALRIHDKHYFLGFGDRLFDFRIKGVLFTVGKFVPIYGLAKIYKIEDGFKKRPTHAWEFSDRPLFKRFLVTYAGVFTLLVGSLIIFISASYLRDDVYISKAEVNKYGVYPSQLADHYGFQPGDRVLKINGKDFERYDELIDPKICEAPGNAYTVTRRGEDVIIKITSVRISDGEHEPFLQLMVPLEIDSVAPNSPAEAINLQEGDRIMKVNDRTIYRFQDMQREFRRDLDGPTVLLIQRIKANDTITFSSEVTLDPQNRIGIMTRTPIQYTTKANSLGDAIAKGTRNTFINLFGQITGLYRVVGPGKTKGPITASSAFGDRFNWLRFWYTTATLSTSLVLWNFLPYPKSALWESVALVYEGVRKRKYPDSFFRKSLSLAWFIFLAQFLWVFVNDIAKLF